MEKENKINSIDYSNNILIMY